MISAAPSRRAAARAVRDAPPLPRMTTFLPAREMPARRAMYRKPSMSVLQPVSLPSAPRTMVLTEPMASAAGSMASQRDITSRL